MSEIVPGEDNTPVRFAWFSLRKRRNHCKFCHWWMFPWRGYYWHSKSGNWISKRKFDPKRWNYDLNRDAAIMKGIPEEYLDELQTCKFYNINVRIPARYGTCLDFWYPGWAIPKSGGSSNKKIIGVVRDWLKEKTWRIMR